ncbi:MAG TPA: hypothetical protein V6D11_07795 [Waterburya sp.]
MQRSYSDAEILLGCRAASQDEVGIYRYIPHPLGEKKLGSMILGPSLDSVE